ncbi:hypothetical protein B5C34_12955 [Pacificimonas flava]|uniref:Abasic site processing protein n=2 Tax=Pacificimonas TaxID=1960290 RepID=A0A219B7D5_9SPHN|nr:MULTISPECIES: SOS response-associated peptidase [Pacificimonas]MBZ6378422.1 SOS response-associated peptidase [Pacificimonas aurantium]OWV34275.1 hypothetical protein B5C34_12955 [Pacificimonas flava]
MCNLYKMRATLEELTRLFGVERNTAGNLEPRDEIFPGQDAPVIATGKGAQRSLGTMRWGFPPPPGKATRPVTNVRNLDSPFWRSALERPARRCLVPVTSFCEWTGETGKKRKVWFSVSDLPVFAFAGIWRPVEGEPPHYAFLTSAPNETVGRVHPKAMPVLLTPDDAALWLEADWSEARTLARPFPDARMVVDDEAAPA